ncbi:putative siderophore iron transporter [Hyaloscypha variabilis]
MEDNMKSELAPSQDANLVYDNDEEEPEIHARTYFALVAMFTLNLVQVLALQGPPAVLSYIGKDLNNPVRQTWVPNALSLVQAVVAPVISSASDTFQARKSLLVGCSVISFIGAAIAPGSDTIYRLIVAQILVGFGFATVPLAYCVPSEILPKKWRPMVQASMNVAASLGACAGPLIIGALTRSDSHTGWRNFYWIQMALWGITALGIFVGYRPPKRHTLLDHLSFMQKIGRLDLPGFALLTAGLTLFLTGLNLGGGIFAWKAVQTLSTLIIGIALLIAFGIYEWLFTKTGIMHHDLFVGGKDAGRTFAICVGLIFIEGILLFSYVIFYPTLTTSLFETDPFLLTAREQPFWVAAGFSTVPYGYVSTKLRNIKGPLFVGFLLLTAGIVGLATIEPSQSTNAVIFSGLAGLGFGAPLVLIIAGVQLSTPHHLIATATAVTTSFRAIAATVFTAIYAAALSTRLASYIPSYVAAGALSAGLPKSSLMEFVEALASDNTTAVAHVPGVNPVIIAAGIAALKQALADGIRVVFIIAAPFGAVACIACFFIGDLSKIMNYHVDAPVEILHAKHHHEVTA